MTEQTQLPMTESRRRIEDLVVRIESAFLQTPGLMLTVAEAQRRFGVDAITSEAILDALVDSSVLYRTRDRVYGQLIPHVAAA